MTRFRNGVLVAASIALGLLAATPVHAASVVKVDRGTWQATGVPSYVTMYIYVPATLAQKPPIVVACHSCGTPVSGYFGNLNLIQAAADKNGFIIVLPEATGRNCWDVGTKMSLTHDGGGDTQAIAQMVKYTLSKYNGDASRVYAMGGSSGAMMTQALMAVYPDVFKAGSARAGVAAGCWADGFDPGQQWSNSCAAGTTNKTAMQWGDGVRAMFPSYTGHRPRVQLFHGDADQTIHFPNLNESIEEWTNVFGLSATPSSTDTFKGTVSSYNRKFWKNACDYTILEAWTAPGGGHSMAYEQDAILKFFGLDTAGGVDPEPACPPGGAGGSGSGGAGSGGASGVGGSGSPAGAGGGGGGGAVVGAGGASVGAGGTGPAPGSAAGGGGLALSAGSGGSPSSSGAVGTGVAGAALGTAGAPSTPNNPGGDPGTDSSGCTVGVTGAPGSGAVAAALGLVLVALRRRRRARA